MTQKGQKKRSWKNWIGGKFNAAGSWIKGHWKPIAGAAAAAAAAGAAIYLGTKDNGPAPPAHHTSPPAAPAAPPAAPEAPKGHAMPGCSQADIDAFRGKPCKKTDDRRFLLKCSKYFREGTGSNAMAAALMRKASRVAHTKAGRCNYTSKFPNPVYREHVYETGEERWHQK